MYLLGGLKYITAISTAKIELFYEKILGRKLKCFASSNELDLIKSQKCA
jgi:hypothetical protein